jgi:hypothetical protein
MVGDNAYSSCHPDCNAEHENDDLRAFGIMMHRGASMAFKIDRASTERNGPDVGGSGSELGSIHPSCTSSLSHETGLAVRNVEPITGGKGFARVRASADRAIRRHPSANRRKRVPRKRVHVHKQLR